MELDASATTPLAPGTYTRRGFTPDMTFDVAGDQAGFWYGTQLFDGFFDIEHDVGSPDVIAVQLARPSAAYGADDTPLPVAHAADALGILKANPSVTILDSGTAMVAGRAASEVTVEYRAGTADLLRVPPGPLSILSGRRLRMLLIDTSDGVVAVLVGGSIAKWQAALDAAAPVVASLRIDG